VNAEPAGIKPESLVLRVGTALVYALVVVVVIVWGRQWGMAVAFGILAALAADEFFALERSEGRRPNDYIGIVAAGLLPMGAALGGHTGLLIVATLVIVAVALWHVVDHTSTAADAAETLFGAVYPGMLAFLVATRGLPDGVFLALAVVASVWAEDVAAYFVGSLAGRHKVAPSISPNKSWEGLLAGVAGCVAVWVALPFFTHVQLSVGLALFTGVSVALAAFVGDLFESRLKREAGVKDSGTALPGHGGFLDRLDSLILAGAVAYWVLWLGGIQ